MSGLFMLSLNPEVISGERIFRNDVFKPISLSLLTEKPDKQVGETDIASIVDANIKILDSIRIPDRFDRRTLAGFLEKTVREDLEKDSLHKEAVELNKYAKDFHTYMRKYFDKVFDFQGKLKEDLLKHVFATSNVYLRSDFPPSFARTLSFSLLTECRFIDIFDMMIRHERVDLIANYNNRKRFERICNVHNNWTDPLDSVMDKIIEMRIGLIWYVDFAHSKTLDEIFKPKNFKKSLIDEEYFFGVLVNIQRETGQFRRALANLSKKTFTIFPSRKDPTVDMLCSVMETMSS